MPDITGQLKTALADRYRIESHLGEGGMATVYLAEDLKHDRKVALKVLRAELAAMLGAERFVQEIKTTASLQHPHILPLFDSGTADHFLYYVMPYIDGESLRDKLNRETQLEIQEAVKIASEVADALDYAHRHGVIHRDIKPENILLHDGRPMVADFGIALAVSAAAGGRMTETGLSLGTPHYMSPEQATGERELDARSDVYSLGATLYEMLAGDPPYTGSTAQAIIAKVITEKAPLVTTHRDTVPPHVAAATAKALSKLPADRFKSAAQFAEALTNPAFTLPATAATAVPRTAPDRLWKRLALSLVGLAAVLFAAALWGWLRPEAPKQVLRYSMFLPEGERVANLGGVNLALSPDGSRLVYVGPGEEGSSQLWLRERDQLRARPLPGTAGARTPFFSPDGRRVAFYTVNPITLKVVSLRGGPPVTLADSRMNRAGGSWTPDGDLYVGATGPLLRVPATGGPPEPVSVLDTARGEGAHGLPHALPNGKGVLFTVWHGQTATETHEVAVLDLTTGEHEVLVQGVFGLYAPTGHLLFVRSDGVLLGARFDQDELRLTGPAVPLLEGVRFRASGDGDVALSQTGTLAYMAGGPGAAGFTVLWVDRDGRAEVAEPGWTFEMALNGGLALSPDGTRIALQIQETTADIWVKGLRGGPLSRLTFEGDRNFRPRWTPDGRSITFLSTRQSQSYDLYQKRADGTGAAELLLDLELRIIEAFWAPDGHWIIFRAGGLAGELGDRDIWGIRPGVDSVPVAVVVTPADEKAATLSPDGRWLAYESNETGRNEVFVRPFPNTGDGKWQVSLAGGTGPLWAHSGRELFYVNGNAELVAADVLTTPTFSLGERRPLFWAAQYNRGVNARQYDVAPDDQRFVFIGPTTVADRGAGSELIVVENFFEELQEKVP